MIGVLLSSLFSEAEGLAVEEDVLAGVGVAAPEPDVVGASVASPSPVGSEGASVAFDSSSSYCRTTLSMLSS